MCDVAEVVAALRMCPQICVYPRYAWLTDGPTVATTRPARRQDGADRDPRHLHYIISEKLLSAVIVCDTLDCCYKLYNTLFFARSRPSPCLSRAFSPRLSLSLSCSSRG